MKRKSMFKMITATLALSVVGGATALLAQNNVTASAESTFAMDTVAAVRIPNANVQNDVSGIRFYVHMDETMRNEAQSSGYGFLVFPQRYLSRVTTGEYHAELDDNNSETTDYIQITGDKKKFYDNDNDGLWTAQAVIAPVSVENYDEPFTCVAYINDGNGGYKYATIDNTFSRNVLQVASAAYIAEPQNRSALATAYALGTTNPVQIADGEDLALISEQVADGEAFNGVSFKLANDITLADGFEPIANTFAGRIDTNGVEISGNFSAAIVKDKTVLTGDPVTENVSNPTKLLEITEICGTTDNGGVYNTDVAQSYVANEDLPQALKENYTGNAVKYPVYGTNDSWCLRNGYSTSKLEAVAKTYNYVQFRLAPVLSDDNSFSEGWYLTIENGILQYARENNRNATTHTFKDENKNTWHIFTVHMDDYISYVDGKTTFDFWDCLWQQGEGSSSNLNGGLDIYIGDIEFILDIPEKFLSIESVSDVFHNDYAETFVETPTLAGDYAGSAISWTKIGNNSGNYYINNSFLEKDKELVKQNYNTVTLNLGFTSTSTNAGWYYWLQGGIMPIVNETEYAESGGKRLPVYKCTPELAGYWQTLTMDLDDFLEYIEGKDKIELFRYYYHNAHADFTLYVGDIEFSYENYDNYYIYYKGLESWDGLNTQKTEHESATPTGSIPVYHNYYYTRLTHSGRLRGYGFDQTTYSGTALQMKWGKATVGSNNGMVKFSNTYTEEQLNALKEKYNAIRFYIGIDDQGATKESWSCTVGGGLMSLATQATEDVNGVKGYKFTADNDLKWTEFTVPMETFVDYVNGKVACDLFKRLECNGQNFYLYLSGFEFVNVAS